jgi:hypothetical protein
VHRDASQLLFVYGQNDPWGAEAFHPSSHDSYSYIAPGFNHGSTIARLTPSDAATATATLKRWAGLPTTAAATTFSTQFIPELDAHNPDLDRRPALVA